MADGFSQDFTGRTVDLLIFQGVKPVGDQKIFRGYGGEFGGFLVTGIQKVAQTFTQLFLTQLGTVPQDPLKGTDFLAAIRTGAIQEESDVPVTFGEAVATLQQQLINEDSALLPLDEQFASATLRSFNLDRLSSKLTLEIVIRAAAGDDLTFFLPVNFSIL